ncbi:Probable phospholipase A1 magnifin [Gryllus bimaculatus]|nr:Probable phospholipase A1 magnifin [Gryllus bimaculatus]
MDARSSRGAGERRRGRGPLLLVGLRLVLMELHWATLTFMYAAYLQRADYNVISVDWSPLAREPCYVQATYTVATVGNCTAQLLDWLVGEGVTTLDAVHVVGFSLGAQVAGHVGLFLQSGRLPRVTGLDPALPLFGTPYKSSKLDSNDAEFVDVIHTNAGHKGKYEPCGDVDFYVNSGYNQPGCESHPDGEPSCSHARAPAYFGESINTNVGFYAQSCCSWIMSVVGWCSDNTESSILMGEYTPRSARGTYYVTTRDMPPYALGKNNNACSS